MIESYNGMKDFGHFLKLIHSGHYVIKSSHLHAGIQEIICTSIVAVFYLVEFDIVFLISLDFC